MHTIPLTPALVFLLVLSSMYKLPDCMPRMLVVTFYLLPLAKHREMLN